MAKFTVATPLCSNSVRMANYVLSIVVQLECKWIHRSAICNGMNFWFWLLSVSQMSNKTVATAFIAEFTAETLPGGWGS